MPTYGRRDYVAESVAMFLAQDYPAKELVILNDCPGQTLVCEAPNVRVINTNTRFENLGDKRNALIEASQGALIAVWDDDDIYLPWRLSYSVEQLRAWRVPLYFPATFWSYRGNSSLIENQATPDLISHPSYVFERELWLRAGRYPSMALTENQALVSRMLQLMGSEWPNHPVASVDRSYVMRIRSHDKHLGIDGRAAEQATEPGTFLIEPCPIADPTLARAVDELVRRRSLAMEYRQSLTQRVLPDSRDTVWLDDLSPMEAHVGYGELGCNGHLGYEQRVVEICGATPPHALSSHAPARLVYALEGKFATFSADVAINDDVGDAATAADFEVRVDGELVAEARNVQPHSRPRTLNANLTAGQQLELTVRHHRWEYCHAVWGFPRLQPVATVSEEEWIVDPLRRAEILRLAQESPVERCIATVGSPGYENWLDDLLGSIVAHGQCPEARLVVFFFGDSPEVRRLADKYQALLIPCRALRPLSVNCKAVLYSVSRIIPARYFLCLDADMSVQDDLRPLFSALEALSPRMILVAREAHLTESLRSALTAIYGCRTPVEELSTYFGETPERTWSDPFVVNDGIFAGSATALSALDAELRQMPRAAEWVDDPAVGYPWRNQFVLNLALSRMGCAVEIAPRFNVQLHRKSVSWSTGVRGDGFITEGERVGILHFSGSGKAAHVQWRDRIKATSLPLSGCGHPDYYPVFLTALREWLGRHGRDALAWSFYGTTDGQHGRVADPCGFPLFAALHAIVKANGCERILETGTARGISAGCLAAAIAHRQAPQVVTMDVYTFPERDDFWSRLPPPVRDCIEARSIDSLAGMRQSLARGERFQAALLDTLHTAEHVLLEFELARRLVCPGGLILIHDAVYKHGTVGQALSELQRRGYGVVRLWTADDGVQEDDGLGLAVIENRRLRPY